MISNNLRNKCDLFAENYQVLKKNFKWEYSMMLRLAASFCANQGMKVDVKSIQHVKEMIRNNTGFFSYFKDISFFILSVLLSLEKDPKDMFLQTKHIYEEMKAAGFRSSPYLTLAAFTVAKQARDKDINTIIERAKQFYKGMKKQHRFLTAADDYGYAAMLATTDYEINDTIKEMSICYELLKKHFGVGNELQSLTHILVMGEEQAKTKCDKVLQIFETLNQKGVKVSKYQYLANLGMLSIISDDVEKITDDIAGVGQYLLDKKGFGRWAISKQDRTLFSSVLVADEYVKDKMEQVLTVQFTNSITNLMIAQQTAMIIAVSSASAAAAASTYSD